MKHLDVATGKIPVLASSTYATAGPASVFDVKTPLPAPVPAFCYLMYPPAYAGQCTPAQLAAIKNGTAVIEDFIVVNPPWEAPA